MTSDDAVLANLVRNWGNTETWKLFREKRVEIDIGGRVLVGVVKIVGTVGLVIDDEHTMRALRAIRYDAIVAVSLQEEKHEW